MNVVGDVKIVGDVPCMKCGYGEVCELSGSSLRFAYYFLKYYKVISAILPF